MKTDLNFGEAIEALKAGKRVRRAGWNGKGMYLWLLPAATIPAEWCKEPHLKQLAVENGGTVECLGSIRMKTADNKVLTGWLASQTDMLSSDWELVEQSGSTYTTAAVAILLLSIALLIGCTARGGWPRFLRPGEASDGAIRREEYRERDATTNFLKGFEARREHAYDLETLGKDIVQRCGKVAAERAMYQLWWSWEPQTYPSNACNMAFVITREPKVQDLAWMICYRTNWLK